MTGTNAKFQAFLDFKKHVATKLKISNCTITSKKNTEYFAT